MKKFATHLQYRWWQYLVCAVVIILFWCAVFQILAQPANYEAVRILFVGEYWDTQPLEKEIASYLTHATSQSISTVEIDIFADQTDQLLPILMAKQYQYDLIIVSDPWMQENIGQNAFGTPIPDQIMQKNLSVNYYTESYDQEEYPFAILLNEDVANRFSSFYNDSRRCYLFISSQSVNCDQATGHGQPGHDAAIKTIEFLVETQ